MKKNKFLIDFFKFPTKHHLEEQRKDKPKKILNHKISNLHSIQQSSGWNKEDRGGQDYIITSSL